jgi:hypothetical protein
MPLMSKLAFTRRLTWLHKKGNCSSLTDLDKGNLKMTTDFRSVYGTLLKEWMGFDQNRKVLKGDYPTLGVFG